MPTTAKLIILKKNICQIGMPEQHLNYIRDPSKSFIFTLSADSGLGNYFFFYPRKTKCLFVKDKMVVRKRQNNEWLFRNLIYV